MVELTELPEIWYVKVTEENKDILSKWRFGKDSLLKLDTFHITGMYFSYDGKLEKGHNPEYKTKLFGKEITFEQFKKWVLKENVVVHCTTQEEWDFVNSKLDSRFKSPSYIWKNYENESCKCFNNNEYSSLDFYKTKNSLIITFQEWCDKFNHVNPFVVEKKSLIGRYVKVINNTYKKHYNIEKGDYLLFKQIQNGIEYWGNLKKGYFGINVHKNKDFELMPEGFNPLNEKTINDNDLLEEAKRRYPVGTKFISAYDKKSKFQVDEDFYSFWDLFNIVVNRKNGPSIYNNGVWAEIISTPLELNITTKLSTFRINHNFNESIKSNNVLLLDIVIQPIKIETISDKLTFKKETKILTIK